MNSLGNLFSKSYSYTENENRKFMIKEWNEFIERNQGREIPPLIDIYLEIKSWESNE